MLNMLCVTGFGQGGVRGQARAGTDGCTGSGEQAAQDVERAVPCLRAVSM